MELTTEQMMFTWWIIGVACGFIACLIIIKN